ncbi:MAG: hypothetical protein DIU78_002540 [Pseudomonadota bacterium]|nr:MAG: hypothetical protein DIU78_22215 [Pseudomonadota bacterium]
MLSKIQVKLFAAEDVNVEEYVPVFHRWIRERVLGELLIDVVDYTHVTDGPHVVLIGHESDYVLDRGNGRLGLLYVHKRGPRPENLLAALRRALEVGKRLETEAVSEPLRFRTDRILVRIADRLAAPGNDETYARLVPAFRAELERVYDQPEVVRVGNPRELFTVEARAAVAPSLDELLQRLNGASA